MCVMTYPPVREEAFDDHIPNHNLHEVLEAALRRIHEPFHEKLEHPAALLVVVRNADPQEEVNGGVEQHSDEAKDGVVHGEVHGPLRSLTGHASADGNVDVDGFKEMHPEIPDVRQELEINVQVLRHQCNELLNFHEHVGDLYGRCDGVDDEVHVNGELAEVGEEHDRSEDAQKEH